MQAIKRALVVAKDEGKILDQGNFDTLEARVNAILELRKDTKKIYKPKIKPPSKEYKDLKKKTKEEQIKILQSFNIRKSHINKLKNEDERIRAIIRNRNENKKTK